MYSYKIGSFFFLLLLLFFRRFSFSLPTYVFIHPTSRNIYTTHADKRERERMKMAMYRWQVTHASPQPYFASRFHCCDDNNNDDNNNNNKIAEAEQKKNCVDSQKRKKKKKQTIIFDGFRFVWNVF